jgi:hypothetical protein
MSTLRGKQLGVYLPDTDERAMGYLAGPSPNNWGILSDGTHISSLLDAGSGKKEDRRSHPLFGHVALLVMQEVRVLLLGYGISPFLTSPPPPCSSPSYFFTLLYPRLLYSTLLSTALLCST